MPTTNRHEPDRAERPREGFVKDGGSSGGVLEARRRAADERLARRLARGPYGLGWLWRWLHRRELEGGDPEVLWLRSSGREES